MEPYSRALVRFLHAAVVGRGQIEAFALGTRLTRITRELSSRDPDAALAKAARSVPDWSGGTRLGEGLRAFNDQWGVRGMARGRWWSSSPTAGTGATLPCWPSRCSVCSGWPTGRCGSTRLKASPGYAPLAAGMAAALPYVDEFVEGHSLDSLQKLAEVISR